MRRLLISMAALSFLGALIGCEHTAGVCDCGCPGGPGAPGAPGMLRPEPLIMPKENGDAKPVALPMEKVKPADNADK